MQKNNLATPAKTIEVLSSYGLSLDKQYGQNFLVDRNILEKIIKASNLNKSDVILEVGGGIGTLSYSLCNETDFVHIVELDRDFLPALKGNLDGFNNFKIHNVNAMDLKCRNLKPAPVKMVANLPYNIAAPLIITLLNDCPSVKSYYIMVQKEMADRFTARPNSSDYNALSVKIQLMGDVKKLFDISPNSFLPKPKVSSTFISILKNNFTFNYKSLLMGIIEDSFHYRRKKMLNGLNISGRYEKGLLLKAFDLSGISTSQRAQELSGEDFLRLTENYMKLFKK